MIECFERNNVLNKTLTMNIRIILIYSVTHLKAGHSHKICIICAILT